MTGSSISPASRPRTNRRTWPARRRRFSHASIAPLAEAGSDKSHLLSATIYLSDMSRKEEMNKVWQGWMDPKNPPARATVGVDLGGPNVLVEIMVIAARR